jgi:hypothetical protein
MVSQQISPGFINPGKLFLFLEQFQVKVAIFDPLRDHQMVKLFRSQLDWEVESEDGETVFFNRLNDSEMQ